MLLLEDGVEAHPLNTKEQRATWLAMRKEDVTASAIGALYGVHDYYTGFGLWAEKSGKIVDEDNEELYTIKEDRVIVSPMERGNLLEPIVANIIAKIRPDWQLVEAGAYYRLPDYRIGATPDYFWIAPEGKVNLQIKTVGVDVFYKKWIDPDTREVIPPLWIALQAAVEASLTGCVSSMVAVMIVDHRMEVRLVEIPLRRKLFEDAKERVKQFWDMVASGVEPDPDYARDAALIMRLYRETDDSEIDLTGDEKFAQLCARRKAVSADKSAMEKEIKAMNAEIVHRLGNASFARIDGGYVTAPLRKRAGFTVGPSEFRQVTVKMS